LTLNDVDASGTLSGLESTLSSYLNRDATLGSATVMSAAMTAQAKAAALAGLLASDTGARTINTAYDQLNRKTQVKQPAVVYFYTDGTTNYGSGASDGPVRPETDYQYDAFGNVILQKSLQYLANAPDPNAGWAVTYFGYDVLNRLTDQVDPLRYYTKNSYDTFGRLYQSYQYATQVTAAPTTLTAGHWNFTAPAPLPAGSSGLSSDNPVGYDRITQYGYDLLDRQTSATKVNTQYSVNGLITLSNVQSYYADSATGITTIVGNTTTYTGYDALGNVISTTDEEGKITYTYYDALGRATATAAPTRTMQGAAASVSLRTTNFTYSIQTGSQGAKYFTATWNSLDNWGDGDVLVTAYATYNSQPVQNSIQLTAAQGDSGISSAVPFLVPGTTTTRITVQKWMSVPFASGWVTVYDTGTNNSGIPSSYSWGAVEIDKIPGNAAKVQLQYTNSSGVTRTLDFVSNTNGNIDGAGIWRATPSASAMPAGTYSFQIIAKNTNDNIINLNQPGTGRAGALSGTMNVTIGYNGAPQIGTVTDAATSVTPLTTQGYDALGNLVVVDRWANGTAGLPTVQGYSAAAADPANDQMTYQRSDILGRVLETVDADGNSEFKSYDINGHNVRTWSLQTDSVNQANGSPARTEKIAIYAFDALGQQIGTIYVRRNPGDPLTSYSLDQYVSKYDAFGELTETDIGSFAMWLNAQGQMTGLPAIGNSDNGTVGAVYQYAKYDADGRIWESSGKDGLANVYGYDLLGNQTIAVELPNTLQISTSYHQQFDAPNAVNVLTTTPSNPLSIGGRVTETVRDSLGRALEQLQPFFTPDSTVSGSTIKTKASAADAAFGGYAVVEGVPAIGSLQFNVSQGQISISHGSGFNDPQFYSKPLGSSDASYTQFFPSLNFSTDNTLLWAVSNPPVGSYEYRVDCFDTQSSRTFSYYGTFTVLSNGSVTYGASPEANTLIIPTIYQTYDRWGNVLTASDPGSRNNGTQYFYNDRNQVIRKNTKESYSAYDYTDALKTVTPSYYYYDDRGELIASQDAGYSGATYRNINRRAYDAGGQLIQEADALNNVKHHVYNALDQEVQTQDALGNITIQGYDRLNQLTNSYSLSYRYFENWQNFAYTYDESGNRTSSSDGQNDIFRAEVTRDRYDTRGNLTMELTPLTEKLVNGGQDLTSQFRKYYAYDMLGNKTSQNNNDGHSESWTYDLYGRVVSHTDLSGSATGTFNYTYTPYGQLLTQASGHGQNLSYSYYENGWLRLVKDLGNGTDTYYEYDPAGHKIHEQFTYFQYDSGTHQFSQIGLVQQNDWETYDTQGLLTSVRDNQAYITYTYDAVGNRREIKSWFQTYRFASETNLDGFYLYDANNRMTLENGSSITGISAQQGAWLGYDAAGNRVAQTKYEGGVSVARTYRYDPEAHLISSTYQGKSDTERHYDNAGRVVEYATYDVNGNPGYDLISDQITYYNLNGWTLEQRTYGSNALYGIPPPANKVDYAPNSGANWNQTTPGPSANLSGWYDSVGNLDMYQYYQVMGPGGAFANTYTYSPYKLYEGYQVSSINATSTTSGTTPGTTTESYDGNGNLYLVTDTWNTTSPTRYFLDNAMGQTLMRTDSGGSNGTTNDFFFYANGQQIGSVGDKTPASTEDYYFTPISDQYPVTSPSQYVVQSSDLSTGMAGIASQVYGDASLWYLIADANGLTNDGDLKEGMLLAIPNQVTNIHNNSSTFKPYDASKIIGDTTPTIKPPPPPKHHSNVLASIVVIAIAVVVSVVTYGAASEFAAGIIGGSLGATGSAVAAAAVAGAAAGAASSAASQLASMALGLQNGFSWSAVGRGALAGGITAGLAEGLDLAAGFEGVTTAADGAVTAVPATGTLASVGRAVVSSVVGQGVNVALGQQHGFSWSAVAGAALASALFPTGTNAQGRPVPDTGEFSWSNVGTDFVSGLERSVVSSSVNVLLQGHGKVDLANIAADSFGNALGNSIVGEMRYTEVEHKMREAQRALANEGVDYFKRTLAAAGVGQDEIDRFTNSSDAQNAVSIARTLTAVQETYGKPFEDLTPDQQAQVLRPLAGSLTSPASDSSDSASAPDSEMETVVVTAKQHPPTLIEDAAKVLGAGADAVNTLVKAVGGEERAALFVAGIQAAIYGVPKTVVNMAVGELTRRPIESLTNTVSSVFQQSVFNGTGDSDSVRVVSDALAGFTVQSVFGQAIGVVKAAGKYELGKNLERFDGPKPTYDVNPAHVPGQRGFNPSKTPLPNDADEVFRSAVPNDPNNPTAWFGKNSNGQIYRYSLGNNGTAHFSGIDGVGDGVRNLTKYAIDRLNGH
jgi:YD repeat-containing protein